MGYAKHWMGSLALLLLLSFAIASPTALADERSEAALNEGSWSLQFAIDQNFDLNSFAGANLSCKKHMSEKTAFRLGLSLAGRLGNSDIHESDDGGPVYFVRDEDLDRDYFSGNLNLLWINYANPDDRLVFFYGLGPQIGYSRDKRELSVESEVNNLDKDYRWSMSAGFRGALGVEWFVANGVSLLAEYGTSLQYEYSEYEQLREHEQSTDRREQISRELRVLADAVRLGVSVYF